MRTRPKFNEQKTTEAAVILLQRSSGSMNYMKLIKLLYLADRAALAQWERPITYDHYVSMKNGQVLSRTYDLIQPKDVHQEGHWAESISQPVRFRVRIKGEALKIKKLSPAEIDLLNEIYDQYGHLDQFQLGELTHSFPEYQDPQGSSIPTDLSSILRALDYDDEDIARIQSELDEEAAMDALFGA